jgi:glycosyltransferase involved in cell wall biosynthesis
MDTAFDRAGFPTPEVDRAHPSDRPHASSGNAPAVWRAKSVSRRAAQAQRARNPRVSVVIPTLNEAKNLEHVLPALPDGLFEVVLVDGASTDGTVETATRLRPDIRVVHQTRSGKGNALACGFAASRGDIIVTLDADGSADPSEITRFVEALVGGADFAKGSRRLAGGGSADITRIRALGNRVLCLIANRLCGSEYTDLCYGYNAFWAERCLPVLELDWVSPPPDEDDGRLWGDGFEIETLVNVRVAQAGLKVVEVPSYELSRLHGVSNLNAPKDGLRVLRTIFDEKRRVRRSRKTQQAQPREATVVRMTPERLVDVLETHRAPISRLSETQVSNLNG